MTTRVEPRPMDLQALVDLYRGRRWVEAAAAAQDLVQRFPQHPFAWKALGATSHELGRRAEAVAAWRIAAQLAGDAESLNNLGLALQESGALAEAETAYLAALRQRPGMAEALGNLGRLYQATGRLVEAETSLRQALRFNPRLAEALNTLAVVLKDSGRLLAAEEASRQAIACRPDYVEAHASRGALLIALGRMAEGEASLRRAIELREDYLDARSALLYTRQFRADAAPALGVEEARKYGAIATRRATRPNTRWAAPADSRLRIGLVSGDLRQHPVGYFLEGPLAQLDRGRVEVFAYPTHDVRDALTDRLRACCDGWSPISGLADDLAAQRIHDDGIHVLFDLAGHSAHGRLPVFAWRPAPVQVAWLGYFATTGVDEIDYLLADPVSVPPEHRAHFSETVWYLPDTRMCFAPPSDAPPVAPLPALRDGTMTFGCFQNLSKVGEAVLSMWAQVLSALPTARLRLQCAPLADAGVRQQMLRRLHSLGITAERVSLHGAAPRAEYLAAYGEVDVVLDTFPFAGGTTTCEALWMGVPTLTLAGDRLAGLQGASMLTAAGLPQWVARSPQQYVDRALALAADLPALAALRTQLRQQVLASPLFDAARFARHLEEAVAAMWRQRRSAPAE